MDEAGVSSEWVARFRRSVRRWYSRSGRDLPWVGERDPYRVWVREIMLQQTTVKAVVPYLERFLERFPSVEQLAASEGEEVLRVWEGLGDYRRAVSSSHLRAHAPREDRVFRVVREKK